MWMGPYADINTFSASFHTWNKQSGVKINENSLSGILMRDAAKELGHSPDVYEGKNRQYPQPVAQKAGLALKTIILDLAESHTQKVMSGGVVGSILQVCGLGREPASSIYAEEMQDPHLYAALYNLAKNSNILPASHPAMQTIADEQHRMCSVQSRTIYTEAHPTGYAAANRAILESSQQQVSAASAAMKNEQRYAARMHHYKMNPPSVIPEADRRQYAAASGKVFLPDRIFYNNGGR